MAEESTQKKQMTRNQMHEKLAICTYQYLLYLSIKEKVDLNNLIEDVFEMPSKDCDPFVKKCLVNIIKNMPEVVINIDPLLKDWTFDRLTLISQAILALGYIEYKYMEIPKPVIINTCVKLAQKYDDEGDYKFINAVLEKI